MRDLYSQQMLDVAKRRFKLLDYIKGWGADRAQANTDEWVLTCPRCLKQKLVVNVATKMWHCWVCYQRTLPDARGKWRVIQGAGSVVELVSELEQVGRDVAMSRVLSGAHWARGEIEQLPADEMSAALQAGVAEAPTIGLPESAQQIVDADMPYLLSRGISQADVEQFGLFICRLGRYANRLIFPVYEDGRLVYFQGRAMRNAFPGEKRFLKSFNPAGETGCAPASDLLMNLDVARHYPRVAITEGPIDCVHAGPSAVCSFGKRLSMTQLGKLLRAGVRAVDLMWDADAVADMELIYPLLSRFFDTRLIRLPSGDPGDFTREQLDAMRRQVSSTPSSLFCLP